LEYYIWLAKLAEKGKITSIFFADSYGVHQTYQDSADATFKGGSQVAVLDPLVLVSAMAAVTKSISFGITGSTSYIRKIARKKKPLLCRFKERWLILCKPLSFSPAHGHR
jgi:alkanesulfonate monooxygenase SsuD/methylene tetrahydromethanopterin reductase-like flavin-dependent oxidoreductase (luciferase family)